MTRKAKKYSYHYPGQRKYFEGLGYGDNTTIARLTGYCVNMISLMKCGERKITQNVIDACEELRGMRDAIAEKARQGRDNE